MAYPLQGPVAIEVRRKLIVPRSLSEVQRKIMRYIARRSEAAETPRGVNRVWLKRAHTLANVTEVEAALEGLVDLGRMEKHLLPDGASVYRRRQDALRGEQGLLG